MAAVLYTRLFHLIAPQFTPHVFLSCPSSPKFEHIMPPLHFLFQRPHPPPGANVACVRGGPCAVPISFNDVRVDSFM